MTEFQKNVLRTLKVGRSCVCMVYDGAIPSTKLKEQR